MCGAVHFGYVRTYVILLLTRCVIPRGSRTCVRTYKFFGSRSKAPRARAQQVIAPQLRTYVGMPPRPRARWITRLQGPMRLRWRRVNKRLKLMTMQAKLLRRRVRVLRSQLNHVRHVVGNSLQDDEERGQRPAAAIQLIDDVPTDASDDDEDMRVAGGQAQGQLTCGSGGGGGQPGA